MSISKNFGKPLNENLSGVSIQLENGKEYDLANTDLAAGSKGTGYLAVNESAGGGPFHRIVKQGGKTIIDDAHFQGGNLVMYTVGKRVGAQLDLDDGPITFSCSGQKHAPKITSTFDAAK